MCLAMVGQNNVPGSVERAELQNSGLGSKELALLENGASWEFHNELLEAFPKLAKAGGYELMRTEAGNSRDLAVIPQPSEGYTASYLKNVVHHAKVYVRPLQQDLPLDITTDDDSDELIVSWGLELGGGSLDLYTATIYDKCQIIHAGFHTYGELWENNCNAKTSKACTKLPVTEGPTGKKENRYGDVRIIVVAYFSSAQCTGTTEQPMCVTESPPSSPVLFPSAFPDKGKQCSESSGNSSQDICSDAVVSSPSNPTSPTPGPSAPRVSTIPVPSVSPDTLAPATSGSPQHSG